MALWIDALILLATAGLGGAPLHAQIAADTVDPLTNSPPDCSRAAASPSFLWPANGKMTPVSVIRVTDPDGDPLAIAITRITQDEPRTGKGPDATGIRTSTARVRAYRAGNGDGRVYHLTFRAIDPQGASCTGTVTVCVPHDQWRSTCGDGGSLVDSTGR
jgi:hypothetical protein